MFMSYNQEVIFLIISMSYIGEDGDILDKVAIFICLIKLAAFTTWSWWFMLKNFEMLG